MKRDSIGVNPTACLFSIETIAFYTNLISSMGDLYKNNPFGANANPSSGQPNVRPLSLQPNLQARNIADILRPKNPSTPTITSSTPPASYSSSDSSR